MIEIQLGQLEAYKEIGGWGIEKEQMKYRIFLKGGRGNEERERKRNWTQQARQRCIEKEP